MKLSYEIIVTDKNGKVIHREKRVSRSWLENYNHLMFGAFNSSNVTVTDRDGLPVEVPGPGYYTFWCKGGAGVDYQGIVIGTDNTAVTISDYKLGAQIAHGVGAGQIQHLATVIPSPTVDATSSSYTLTRSFINQSGSSITVREIGLYGRAGAIYIGYVRDVLGTEKVIPDGGAIAVIYTVKAVA